MYTSVLLDAPHLLYKLLPGFEPGKTGKSEVITRQKGRAYYHKVGVQVWHIQDREFWELPRVSPVQLLSVKRCLSWIAQSRNAQAAYTLK